jgi:hypothetical protein
MKKCLAIAVLLLASSLSTAQAQYTFEYGGRTITIDPDRGTVQIPGVYDNTGKKAKRPRGEEGDLDRPAGRRRSKRNPPHSPHPKRQPRPALHRLNRLPLRRLRPLRPPLLQPLRRPLRGASRRPRQRPLRPPIHLRQHRPPLLKLRAPAPAPVAAPAPPPPQQKQATAPAASTLPSANSPLGVWLTEEKEGKVRIEACGANLCGYSVDKKSNQNGEQVLINMKPAMTSGAAEFSIRIPAAPTIRRSR